MTQKKKKKRKKTDQADMRGTDEPFLRLMGIGGTAVLKLLGIAPGKADEYAFRSVTLKERRMEPDVEAIPMLEGDGKRVYIEFQGILTNLSVTALLQRSCLHVPRTNTMTVFLQE